MKKFHFILVLAISLLALTGCFHKHTFSNADCTSPKTCTGCGETEGVALGHTWTEATCTAPKTCKACHATEGSALGHDWKAATCTAPKICKTCNTTEGSAKGHNYSNGKCTSCYASDPNYKTPEQVFSAVKSYIKKYGSTSSAGNSEYYINSNLAAVYRSNTDSILFRYKHYVSGYTFFNVLITIYNNDSFEIGLTAAPSNAVGLISQDISMKKTALTTHTQVIITDAGYRNQTCSQEATVGLRELLPYIEQFLKQQGLSLEEWGFTNY